MRCFTKGPHASIYILLPVKTLLNKCNKNNVLLNFLTINCIVIYFSCKPNKSLGDIFKLEYACVHCFICKHCVHLYNLQNDVHNFVMLGLFKKIKEARVPSVKRDRTLFN